MIYSIGYQKLPFDRLISIMEGLQIAALYDVRSKPVARRNPAFNRGALEAALGARYEWHGATLGGFAEIARPAIEELSKETRNILLMCFEEAPGECHRHFEIALRLRRRKVTVTHIFRDELIPAGELERAINADDEYEYEPLSLSPQTAPEPPRRDPRPPRRRRPGNSTLKTAP